MATDDRKQFRDEDGRLRSGTVEGEGWSDLTGERILRIRWRDRFRTRHSWLPERETEDVQDD